MSFMSRYVPYYRTCLHEGSAQLIAPAWAFSYQAADSEMGTERRWRVDTWGIWHAMSRPGCPLLAKRTRTRIHAYLHGGVGLSDVLAPCARA